MTHKKAVWERRVDFRIKPDDSHTYSSNWLLKNLCDLKETCMTFWIIRGGASLRKFLKCFCS
jgi:hypothetical protein